MLLYEGGSYLTRPSLVMHSDRYWDGALAIERLPRDDVYNLSLADHIVGLAYATSHFTAKRIAEGQQLPVFGRQEDKLLQLVIDGRTIIGNYRDVHPAGFSSDLEVEEFDMQAHRLFESGPAERHPAARVVWRAGQSAVELSRLVVYACPGIHAPYVGRPAASLLEPLHIVPNIILPWIRVGQTFQPPTIGRNVRQEFKVAQAKILAPMITRH